MPDLSASFGLSMRREPERPQPPHPRHWGDAVLLLVGLWLMLSPWLMNYGSMAQALGSGFACGAVLAFVGLAAVFRFRHWPEMVAATAALWLAISPWMLEFVHHKAAACDAVVVAGIALLMVCWTMTSRDVGEDV